VRRIAGNKKAEAGRARHSVRAVLENQNAAVGKGRRAEDCPPYLREGNGGNKKTRGENRGLDF
jgi:hypothetical protein